MADVPDYHTAPVEAAEVANDADVKLVVFYHLTPPPPASFFERIYVRDVGDVRDEGWLLGDDGLRVELPAGSDNVAVRWLDERLQSESSPTARQASSMAQSM